MAATVSAQPGSSVAAKPVDFGDEIRPILTRHCIACHGGVAQAADLSFVYRQLVQHVLKPDATGTAPLIKRVTSSDDNLRMPPPEHGPPLSDNEVALLESWVEQGANWTEHWAYRMPVRRERPAVTRSDWCRQSLDFFVLEQLDTRGIEPADDERAERWLRRVTFDLVGLPPTLAERAAFLSDLADRGQPAYEAVVDRLLASPRFGERWASVWFDQVRYADSRGHGEDSPRAIWKYRDWVIDALNRDLPYDEFTVKQIAGDLLPDGTIEDRLATAAHRLTHTNEEGGTDDEEFRVAAVLDRIHTTWQTWQGLTMGCVQCHDHPYDPIRREEYYQFMALFNNTADCDLTDDWPTIAVPLDTRQYDRATKLDNEIRELQESIWRSKHELTHLKAEWSRLRISRATTSNGTKIVVDSRPDGDEFRTIGTIASNPTIVLELPLAGQQQVLTGIRLNIEPLEPETAVSDAEVGFVISNIDVSIRPPDAEQAQAVKLVDVVGDDPFPYFDPLASLQAGNGGFGAYTRVHHPRSAVLLPDAPVHVAPGSTLIVKLRFGIFDLAAFSLVARRGSVAISSDPRLSELQGREQLASSAERLRDLKAERAKIESVATPVLIERASHLARPSHVFERGLFLTKAQRVQPAVPQSLNAGGMTVATRLELANWLVDRGNPLTARVAVNRLWARMFGIGLVATEEDFGSTGDKPSHPELLDDLAVRFRDDYGWSVKRLLREIALSRTYRQASRLRPDIGDRDPQNRWLARGPRHTLPAEAMRDQMLAISGLLSDKMHGPPVYPPLPPGVWKARQGTWTTPPVGDADRYRRSVYTHIKRSIPFPTYATFDAPSRDVCVPKRLRSNTPLQPLMLLNDAAFVECAQAFAKLMQVESENVRDQIAHGFLRATCRPPRPSEVDHLMALYQQAATTNDPDMALQSVAAVLLNLDEVMTK
jgi:hypothetical protein